ncbi:hypothetical protein AG1IA_07737 [Rhizoctonia solani AG-1 IA]|uniref:Uncharacterized protein n=1 Tax=Thanatephorus cucumeris (strain AG1-IA) TaxID=983506 RepID=L8WN89_THACA|nr:hypothetical protein AG1IA_07737 [Rhizoctonia solani AG-1 IA]
MNTYSKSQPPPLKVHLVDTPPQITWSPLSKGILSHGPHQMQATHLTSHRIFNIGQPQTIMKRS